MTLGATGAFARHAAGGSAAVRQLESADDDSCGGSDEPELAGSRAVVALLVSPGLWDWDPSESAAELAGRVSEAFCPAAASLPALPSTLFLR
jgi:hypothetical protein